MCDKLLRKRSYWCWRSCFPLSWWKTLRNVVPSNIICQENVQGFNFWGWLCLFVCFYLRRVYVKEKMYFCKLKKKNQTPCSASSYFSCSSGWWRRVRKALMGLMTGSGGVPEPAADVVVTSDPLPGDTVKGLSSAPGPTHHLLSLWGRMQMGTGGLWTRGAQATHVRRKQITTNRTCTDFSSCAQPRICSYFKELLVNWVVLWLSTQSSVGERISVWFQL